MDILMSRSERYLDRTARSLAQIAYREVRQAGSKPCFHALNVSARKYAQLQATVRAYNRDDSVSIEHVWQAQKAAKHAALALQAKYRVLDRYYDLSSNKEVLEMIEYVDSLVDRVTFYLQELNEIQEFIHSK